MNKKYKNHKKILKIMIFIAVAASYYILLYYLFLTDSFNSDLANHVLEGNDILHGNLFLKDWSLSGISFIATDLVLYTIAVLFTGISQESAAVAAALGIFLLTVVCFLIMFEKNRKRITIWGGGVLLFLAIAGIPRGLFMSLSRVHTACVVEAMLGLYFLNKFSATENNKKIYSLIIAIICFSFAAMSDALSLLMIIIPAFLVSLWSMIFIYAKDGRCDKRYLYQVFIVISAVCLSFVLDKTFYYIGGANKNSFLGLKHFIYLEEYANQITLYLKTLLALFQAEFPGKALADINIFPAFLRISVILLGFVCIIYNIVQWIRYKSEDYLTVVLSVGVVLASLVFATTNIAIDLMGGRYIATFPAIFIVIIVRTVANVNLCWDKIHGIFIGKVVAGMLCGALILEIALPLPNGDMTHLNQQETLAKVLEDNKLTNGYSSFWNASVITVISNNKVKIRSILGNPDSLMMEDYFCKREWYFEPANFVVVADGDESGVTYDNMISALGTPCEIIDVCEGRWQILKYDFDISKYLRINML